MKTRSSGFTLIELLVVIAIIAILAAILFPVFIRVKQAAVMSQCQSNIKQQGIAIQLYSEANGGRLPHYSRGSGVNRKWWYDVTQPYMRNDRIYRCPALEFPKGAEITQFGKNGRVFGYGVNYPHVFVETGFVDHKTSEFPRTTKTMLLCDAYTMEFFMSTRTLAECGFGVVYCRGTHGSNPCNWSYGNQYIEDGNVAGRHAGNSNKLPYGKTTVLYLDLHAKVWPKEYMIQEYGDMSDCRNGDPWAHCDNIQKQRTQ